MDPGEPTGYENEPVEHFDPLPADLYCTFFDLEMGSRQEDCFYYDKRLAEHQCQTVLELGCGTGRIVEFLNKRHYRTIGIDSSHEMLLFNRDQRISATVEMDMCHLGFSRPFDAVIIPHNTLNLLSDEQAIRRCLKEIKGTLNNSGFLVLQLFSLTKALREQAGRRLFQFALFDTGKNGKLVKETIKIYSPETSRLLLEERYKLRSFGNPALNRNYHHVLPLTIYSASKWFEIISSSGFSVLSTHSGHNGEPFDSSQDSALLITAQRL